MTPGASSPRPESETVGWPVPGSGRSDPSQYSFYVDSDFYRRLVEEGGRWDDEWRPADRDTRADIERLLVQEAHLLDENRLEEWCDMFARECLYWVPITPGGGDPRNEATLAFDDRRRLEDRVYWLRTGLVWGQIPPSRTVRMISNIDVSEADGDAAFWVRSNFSITEFRAGAHRVFAGRYRHTIRRENGALKIFVKRTDLIDSEHGHDNLTIIF